MVLVDTKEAHSVVLCHQIKSFDWKARGARPYPMAYPQPTHSRSANTSNRKTSGKPAGLPKLLPALALTGATLGLPHSPARALTQFAITYAPANWSQSIQGNGIIHTDYAPLSAGFSSWNRDNFSPSIIDFTIAAPSPGTASFDWDYASRDLSFGSRYNPFGYLLNGSFTELASDGGWLVQYGSASFSLLRGDVFGFRRSSHKLDFGSSAYTFIFNFNAPVAPGPLPLLGAGAAIGWSRRLRYRLRAALPASPQGRRSRRFPSLRSAPLRPGAERGGAGAAHPCAARQDAARITPCPGSLSTKPSANPTR